MCSIIGPTGCFAQVEFLDSLRKIIIMRFCNQSLSSWICQEVLFLFLNSMVMNRNSSCLLSILFPELALESIPVSDHAHCHISVLHDWWVNGIIPEGNSQFSGMCLEVIKSLHLPILDGKISFSIEWFIAFHIWLVLDINLSILRGTNKAAEKKGESEDLQHNVINFIIGYKINLNLRHPWYPKNTFPWDFLPKLRMVFLKALVFLEFPCPFQVGLVQGSLFLDCILWWIPW